MGPKESAPRNLIMVPTSKLQELGVVSDVTHCAQLWNLWDPRTDSSRVAGAAESPKPTQPKPTQPKESSPGLQTRLQAEWSASGRCRMI